MPSESDFTDCVHITRDAWLAQIYGWLGRAAPPPGNITTDQKCLWLKFAESCVSSKLATIRYNAELDRIEFARIHD